MLTALVPEPPIQVFGARQQRSERGRKGVLPNPTTPSAVRLAKQMLPEPGRLQSEALSPKTLTEGTIRSYTGSRGMSGDCMSMALVPEPPIQVFGAH